MRSLFVILYKWFEQRKPALYGLLAIIVLASVYSASRLTLEEDINSFFGDSSIGKKQEFLKNFKMKDRIVVLVSGNDPDEMVEVGTAFAESLQPLEESGLIKSVTDCIASDDINANTQFVYNHLPIFLTEADYARLDSTLTEQGVERCVENCYNMLTSPSGMFIGDVLLRDPLNIGTHLLRHFENLGAGFDYEIYDDHLFSRDMSTMLMFVEPANGMGQTKANDALVTAMDEARKQVVTDNTDVQYVGGPIAAVGNARQIKHDAALTLSLALIILIPVLWLCFRNKRTIPLILLPPMFGGVFALGIMALVQNSISGIALGAGAVVLGIALSYSIHVIAHSNHTDDPIQIIEDLAYPLTLGCFTTIGAFLALLFTHSALLQDMGLFAALTLVGTTLFSLVFLPHFLPKGHGMRSRLLDVIESANGYAFENKKVLIGIITVVTFVCLFFYNDVRFDSDMSHINYIPKKMAEAEERVKTLQQDSCQQVYIVSTASDIASTIASYEALDSLCASFVRQGSIESFVGVNAFMVPQTEQTKRIERWNTFWLEHKAEALSLIRRYAAEKGLRENAFQGFEALLNTEFTPCRYTTEELAEVTALKDWITCNENEMTLVSRISIAPEHKEDVYEKIGELNGQTIIDRAYFSSKMVSQTSDDFNYILLVSSLIVFIALLISYGRIELTLLTFLPMCVSWVIILGCMALLDVRFNIVNIILATFIFGIGDDFSIFIMDGLMQEHCNGKKLLGAHKSAIFFSAFTTIVGMGVMIFAQHPALRSIAAISVLGLCVVVLVAYTVQPFLFALFITKPIRKGGHPYTLLSLLTSIYAFLFFFVGCLILQVLHLVLRSLPIDTRKKKTLCHKAIWCFSKVFLACMANYKITRLKPEDEDYSRPAVIIANHQSFIDILLMLSTTPKVVLLTNDWVWRSPFFGSIIRYADFCHTADGYECLVDKLKTLVADGYSVMIFPEGTRSADCAIGRFHKGAFYLAQRLQIDILPIVLYGPGLVSSKRQGFHLRRGIIVAKTMKRIPFASNGMGATYQEQAKCMRAWFKNQYKEMEATYSRAQNPYFRQALIHNYIYKGPVLEWYMRIKCRIDGYYGLWDTLVPRQAKVTDIGCGYGQLSFMLAMLSPDREVTGIDYDADKIELASHSHLCRHNVRFLQGDMCQVDLPQSDAFIFNDSLHYVNAEAQEKVLHHCVEKLLPGGSIIVRDGDASDQERHKSILRTELWSTRIMRFNKTSEPLHFVSKPWMQDFATRNHLRLAIKRCDKTTSETLYIYTREI